MKTLKSLFFLPFALMSVVAHAQTQPAGPGAQMSGMPDPDQVARQQAEHDAIPLTPEEILRLGKRLKDVDFH